MLRTLSLTFLIVTTAAFAQLDSNTITVTASRSANLQPDQAVFAVYVDTTPDVGLDVILGALQPVGITMGNFASVANVQSLSVTPAPPQPQPPPVEWAFALPVPLAKLKDAAAALTALQSTIGQDGSGLKLSFSVQGAQVAPETQQAQSCVLTDVLADARAQAQRLANAAGLMLGSVLAMSGSTSMSSGNLLAPGAYIGRFYSSSIGASYLPCSMTVKFAAK